MISKYIYSDDSQVCFHDVKRYHEIVQNTENSLF